MNDFDDKNSSDIFERYCGICRAEQYTGLQKIITYAEANHVAKSKAVNVRIPPIRVRLLNDKNNIFYDTLNNLYYKDGKFFISNQVSTWEHVRYAGQYLGIRDKNDNRVYEGDVVLGVFTDEYRGEHRKFWGMAFECNIGRRDDKGAICRKYKNASNVFLEHDGNSFPSPLDIADEILICGNVIDGNEDSIQDPDYQRLPHSLNYFYDYQKWSNVGQINI